MNYQYSSICDIKYSSGSTKGIMSLIITANGVNAVSSGYILPICTRLNDTGMLAQVPDQGTGNTIKSSYIESESKDEDNPCDYMDITITMKYIGDTNIGSKPKITIYTVKDIEVPSTMNFSWLTTAMQKIYDLEYGGATEEPSVMRSHFFATNVNIILHGISE